MKDFDLKSAFITFLVTAIGCLVMHVIVVDGLKDAVYSLTLDNQVKNYNIEQAVNQIRKVNSENQMLKMENQQLQLKEKGK